MATGQHHKILPTAFRIELALWFRKCEETKKQKRGTKWGKLKTFTTTVVLCHLLIHPKDQIYDPATLGPELLINKWVGKLPQRQHAPPRQATKRLELYPKFIAY
eukprot:2387556-Amphidinium_carterae.2